MSEAEGKLADPDEQWRRTKEKAKAQARLFTFEGAVEELEALCLRHAPGPGTAPERYSDGWYAREILRVIGAVRSFLEQGRPSNAAAQALTAGYLAGDWPSAQKWREQQEARQRGGRAAKFQPGIQAAVDRLVSEYPRATVEELWNLIPESEEAEDDPIGGFIVYRDGSEVLQVDDETGRRDKPISFRSFCRYVTRARRK